MSLLKGTFIRRAHPSDETISRLVCGELSTLSTFRAQTHLEKCWQCRVKRDVFERAAMIVTEHRNHLAEQISNNPQRRATLLADLHQRVNQVVARPLFSSVILGSPERTGTSMSPVLASAAIILAAVALLIWVWQRPPISVNAAQLLGRAENFDRAVQHGKPGVIYQRVRIKTSQFKTEHEIYRDAQSVRRRSAEQVQGNLESAKSVLASVGLDWDAPLSAFSYQEWHDRQLSVSDTISKTDGNLLTLTTKVPGNGIHEETLTVRASDFHPIGRTIYSSSYGDIEITEVDYAVLDWSGVNESLFEPLNPPGPGNSIPLPLLAQASAPLVGELDSAELSSLIVLNRLKADQGEQIGVTRTDHEVVVGGVVETKERKQEIVAALRPLTHVRANILSVTDQQIQSADSPPSTHLTTVQSVDVQTSPLEEYLSSRSSQKSVLNDTSRSLLDAALKVRQSASALQALKTRFSALGESARKNSVEAQLAQSYSERLSAGLDAEDSTLRRLGLLSPKFISDNGSEIDLKLEVNRNEARCRELIAGNAGTTRSVPDITAEIFESIARIRAVLAVSRQSQQ